MMKRFDWLQFGIIALGPILLFGPMLLRGEVLFWGTPILQFIPWHDFALDVIKNGNFPFWNPLVGFGAPLFANYQSALLYPPNALLLLAGPSYGHGVLVTIHLIWAGLGMGLLARKMGLPPRGQMVAGLAFSLSGYLVARGSFISINHAAAWLPWIILASERLVEQQMEATVRGRIVNVVLLGTLFGLQWLAGHAQTSWYTLVLAIAWVTWRSLRNGNWARLMGTGGSMALSGLVGFSLAAAQLVPTIEYLLQSGRSLGLDREFALTYSFWPWRLTGLIAPDLFGNPSLGNYWGYGNYWEDAIYIGVFPLLMAVGALALLLRRKHTGRRLVIFLAVTGLLAFVFSLGKNTPIFTFLYENIPTFNLFQAPTRWNLLLIFSLSLLAGIGVSNWHTPEGRGLYWTRLGTAGAGIVGVASFLGARLLGDVQATFVPAFARAGLLLFTAGLLTLFLNKSRKWTVLAGLGAFLMIDLVTAGYGLNPGADQIVFQGQSHLGTQISGHERIYMPPEQEQRIKFEQTHRFDTFDPGIDWKSVRDVGLPNTAMLDDIRSANNFDPFTPARYLVWMQWLANLEPEQQSSVLKSVGVRWLAQPDKDGLFGVSYADLGSSRRVKFAPRAVAIEAEQATLDGFSALIYEESQPVYIETSDIGNLTGGAGEAQISSDPNPNRVVVETSSSRGGWLVLNDSWYPGWKATIDGETTDVFRANYLFMSVWVPAGQHEVEFRYLPGYFRTAAFLSGIAWAGVIAIAIWQRRK